MKFRTINGAKSMTAERFKAMVDAYGGSPARWPDDERAAGLGFMANNPEHARLWLREAQATDRMLDLVKQGDLGTLEQVQSQHWRALARLMREERDSVVIPFTPPVVRPETVSTRRPLPLIWATGIGLAACIAGASVGIKLSMASLSNVRAQSVLESAQMIDAGG